MIPRVFIYRFEQAIELARREQLDGPQRWDFYVFTVWNFDVMKSVVATPGQVSVELIVTFQPIDCPAKNSTPRTWD
ncbi:hypothetical protein GCM10023191_005950 [Actinoallomurus oryzae]|uniref:Uncharacterized protein n=1 Tax=Actinoallomurus oryzae TaxID=502180 RepID=A0ABP8PBZ0_9ACTN